MYTWGIDIVHGTGKGTMGGGKGREDWERKFGNK